MVGGTEQMSAAEAKLLELHAQGVSDQSIAKALGVHPVTAGKYRRRLARRLGRPDLERPNGYFEWLEWTPELDARLMEMDAAGRTLEQMAAELGIDRRRVKKRRGELGLGPSRWSPGGRRPAPLTPDQKALAADPQWLDAARRFFLAKFCRGERAPQFRFDMDEVQSALGWAVVAAAQNHRGHVGAFRSLLFTIVSNGVINVRQRRTVRQRRFQLVTDIEHPGDDRNPLDALAVATDDAAAGVEKAEERERAKSRAADLLAALAPGERVIVEAVFGFGGAGESNLGDVARSLGKKRRTVRATYENALNKLRQAAGLGGPPKPPGSPWSADEDRVLLGDYRRLGGPAVALRLGRSLQGVTGRWQLLEKRGVVAGVEP